MVAGDPGQGGASWSCSSTCSACGRSGHEVHLVEPVDRLEPASVRYFDRAGCGDFDLEGSAALLVRGSEETRRRLLSGAGPLARRARTSSSTSRGCFATRSWSDRRRCGSSSTSTRPSTSSGTPRGDRHGLRSAQPLRHRRAGAGRRRAARCRPAGATGSRRCRRSSCRTGRWPAHRRTPSPRSATGAATGRSSGTDGATARRRTRCAGSSTLPELTGERLVLALAIHPDETTTSPPCGANGWELRRSARGGRLARRYGEFVRGSKGELGHRQGGLRRVPLRLVQRSQRLLPRLRVGRWWRRTPASPGICRSGRACSPSRRPSEAAAGIEEIAASYERHAVAARALAEGLFDSRLVLSRLLDTVSSTSAESHPDPAAGADTVS